MGSKGQSFLNCPSDWELDSQRKSLLMNNQIKRVFVTVGSTKFDELIEMTNTIDCHAALALRGVQELVVQYPQTASYVISMGMEQFCLKYHNKTTFLYVVLDISLFKPSIEEEFRQADLIISHGGAWLITAWKGSVFESLRAKKKLIIVVNKRLMHDHQWELAEAMQRNNYSFVTTCETLIDTIRTSDFNQIQPLPEPRIFPLLTVLYDELTQNS
eukprot:jgi/Galph1/4837/GphlegSOOS_G3452.1